MTAASGEPRQFVIYVDNRAVHRCPVDAPAADGYRRDIADRLTRLSRRLGDAQTVGEVASVITHDVAAVVDGVYSNLALIDGTRLRIVHQDSLTLDIASRYQTVPIDDSTPLGTAVRTRRPVILPSLRSYEARYPHMIEDTDKAGLAATMSFPLIDRELLGAIGVGWTQQRPIVPDHALTNLAAISRECGRALASLRR